ncbi:MAG TPA: 16S rRNA (cytosine(1402)-N(4))-methyltransferase RsmH [Candidatus Limnocylindria bacterium]|nr:16S rRNA (cytosine(1402)-N(4))-methyltransferase RsmH [Candidatus Limnocylindria bacterium]
MKPKSQQQKPEAAQVRTPPETEPGAGRGFTHVPVMMREVLEALRPADGRIYLDGTLGGGGHARAILEASSPGGFLYGCDRDEAAIRAASERLAPYSGRFELRQGVFEQVDWVPEEACAGILLDLGVSSHQLDTPGRGFSFMADGPLDMRMNPREGITAAEILNSWPEGELARLFWEYGDERAARRIARRIVEERQMSPMTTTGQLAALIERVEPRRGRPKHPATQSFQALRIATNDELGILRRGLETLWTRLARGGRFAIITFHSLEDRVVKEYFRALVRDYDIPGPVDRADLRVPRAPYALAVTRKALRASEEETAANPRARSAQLRVVEKC